MNTIPGGGSGPPLSLGSLVRTVAGARGRRQAVEAWGACPTCTQCVGMHVHVSHVCVQVHSYSCACAPCVGMLMFMCVCTGAAVHEHVCAHTCTCTTSLLSTCQIKSTARVSCGLGPGLSFPHLAHTARPNLTCADAHLQATWTSVPAAPPWTTSGTGRPSTSPPPSATPALYSGGSCSVSPVLGASSTCAPFAALRPPGRCWRGWQYPGRRALSQL